MRNIALTFLGCFTILAACSNSDDAEKPVAHVKNGDVTITAFMVVRFCKFTLAVVFLWLYAALVGQNLKAFGFTMMLFYFIYLVLETYTLYLFEKKRMISEKKEKDEQNKK